MTYSFDPAVFMAWLFHLATASGFGMVIVTMLTALCGGLVFVTVRSLWHLARSYCTQTFVVEDYIIALMHFIYFSALAKECGYSLAILLTLLCSVSVFLFVGIHSSIATVIFVIIRSFEENITKLSRRRRASMRKRSSWSMDSMLFRISLLCCLVDFVSVSIKR